KLDTQTVTNTGTIEVLANGALTVDLTSSIDNTNGHITVDSSGTLTATATPINNGTVTDASTLTVTGSAVIENGTLVNSGQLNVSGTGNKLDTQTVTHTGPLEEM